MQRTVVAVVVAGALAVTAAGCGDDEGGTSAGPETTPTTRTTPTSTADADTVYTMDAMVLEDAEHGPQLCQVMLTSYPPQCGGPDVVAWDWAQAEGAETANDTTWGFYRVVGTWDREAEALTLTEPPTVPPDPGEPGGPADPGEVPEPGDAEAPRAPEATHATSELREIAEALTAAGTAANVDEARQVVVADVYVTDDALQAEWDEKYGPGVVVQQPWLTPVEGG